MHLAVWLSRRWAHSMTSLRRLACVGVFARRHVVVVLAVRTQRAPTEAGIREASSQSAARADSGTGRWRVVFRSFFLARFANNQLLPKSELRMPARHMQEEYVTPLGLPRSGCLPLAALACPPSARGVRSSALPRSARLPAMCDRST